MKKNTVKKIAALAAALTMSVSALPAVGVSANTSDIYASGYEWYNAYTNKYYDTREEAVDASSSADVYSAKQLNKDYKVNFSPTYPYYSSFTKYYYPSSFAAAAVSKGDYSCVMYGGPEGSAVYDGNHRYYSSYTRRYYSTYSEAVKYSGGNSIYVTQVSSNTAASYGTYSYYSTYTGKYYSTYSAALSASLNNPNYVKSGYYYAPGYTTGYYYSYNGSGDYYNSNTNTWYPTLADALAASGNAYGSYVSYTGTYYEAYKYNGKLYASMDDAKRAGATDNADITIVSFTQTAPSKTVYYQYYEPYYYNNKYYYNDVYYTGPYGEYYYKDGRYYNYYDPYYYYYSYTPGRYYYNGQYYNYRYYSNGRYYYTNDYVYSTKPAEAGVPYLAGNSGQNSWDRLAAYTRNRQSGAVVSIMSNGSSTVPNTFMSAVKGKNINVNITMDNGAKWCINGKNIDYARSVDLEVSYNVDVIPEALVKKAKGEEGITTGQFGIGDGSDFGFSGACTVKFPAKYAYSFAKTYIYDGEKRNLTLVSKSTVDSNGYVTFTASEGGVYLIVLS